MDNQAVATRGPALEEYAEAKRWFADARARVAEMEDTPERTELRKKIVLMWGRYGRLRLRAIREIRELEHPGKCLWCTRNERITTYLCAECTEEFGGAAKAAQKMCVLSCISEKRFDDRRCGRKLIHDELIYCEQCAERERTPPYRIPPTVKPEQQAEEHVEPVDEIIHVDDAADEVAVTAAEDMDQASSVDESEVALEQKDEDNGLMDEKMVDTEMSSLHKAERHALALIKNLSTLDLGAALIAARGVVECLEEHREQSLRVFSVIIDLDDLVTFSPDVADDDASD